MKKLLMIVFVLSVFGMTGGFAEESATAPAAQTDQAPQAAPARRPMNPFAAAMKNSKRRQAPAPATDKQPAAAPAVKSAKESPAPSNQNQLVGSSSSQLVSSSGEAPATTNQAQLIRNLPYQPASSAPSGVATASKSEVPSDSQVNRAIGPGSSRVAVCVLGGFEQSNMSAEECKTKGGKWLTTAEPTKSSL